MKITSLDKEIGKLLESFYIIPRFQRPYSWEKENVEEFLDDIESETTGSYFIGPVVVYKLGDMYGVVDGQQRLTTITMLLCAIRNEFKRLGHADLAAGTHQLIEKKDINNKDRFILQTETSYPYFQIKIQSFEKTEEIIKELTEENLLKRAFDIIFDFIQMKTTGEKKKAETFLKRLREKVLALKVIYVELDSAEDAYTVFETLNTRGKDLTTADLIKNHLLRLLPTSKAEVDVSKDNWNEIVEGIQSSPADLEIDSFFLHFWLSRFKFLTLKKLFKEFRLHIKVSNARAVLLELAEDAVTYREIQEVGYKRWDKNELHLKSSIEAIVQFKVKLAAPMILSILREHKKGRLKSKLASDALAAIEKFHFIFTAITSQRSSGTIARIYADHARELFNAIDLEKKRTVINSLKARLREKTPNYQEFEVRFKEVLYSEDFPKQKRLVQYILGKFTNHYSKDEIPFDISRLSIEHIASQHPKMNAGIDKRHVASLGNLIFVPSKLNGKLENLDFKKKKKKLLSSSARHWLDANLVQAQKWDEKGIEKRLSALTKTAYEEIWSF